MNTEDLIQIWQEQDNKIEKNIAVNQHLLKSVTMQKIKSSLTILKGSNIFELITNFLFLFWLISVIENCTSSTPLLLSFIVLYLLMLSSIIFNIQNLYLAMSITYETSIVETQKKLERLKLYELYETNALYFIIPICSIPFILVLGKGILGLDVHTILGTTYLLSFFAGSLIIGILIVWFIKLFPNHQIEASMKFMEEIKQFDV